MSNEIFKGCRCLCLVLRLRMGGAIPPFFHMPSYHANGQLCLLFVHGQDSWQPPRTVCAWLVMNTRVILWSDYQTWLLKSFGHEKSIGVISQQNKQEKLDGQYTCNVTLRRVRESLLLWKSYKYYLLVCAFVRVCVRACGYPGAWACACA